MSVGLNQMSVSSINRPMEKTNQHYSVQFRGALGDEFVSDIKQDKNVDTNKVMDKVKGFLGLNKDKVRDVFDSFIPAIKNLNRENKELRNNLYNTQYAVQKELEDCKLRSEFEIRGYKYRLESSKLEAERAKQEAEIARQEAQTAQQEAEIAKQEAQAAKDFAAKYEPMTRIKSVEEIGIITPDEFIDIATQEKENRNNALESMFTFLTTGEGEEEVMKQLERNRIMNKAYDDGIADNPSVYNKLVELNNSYFIPRKDDAEYLLNMVDESLEESSDTNGYKYSKAAKQMMLDNAVALIMPFVNPEYGVEAPFNSRSNYSLADMVRDKINSECKIKK